MIQNTTIKSGGCGCSGAVGEIIGDGVTTTFAVAHGLNSKEVVFAVRQAAAPFAAVNVPAVFTSSSVITFTFVVAPAAGEVFLVALERASSTFAVAGDGVTTDFVITHNLGTRNLIVGTRQSFSPFEKVNIPTEFTTINSLTLRFAAAPAVGEVFRIALIPTC